MGWRRDEGRERERVVVVQQGDYICSFVFGLHPLITFCIHSSSFSFSRPSLARAHLCDPSRITDQSFNPPSSLLFLPFLLLGHLSRPSFPLPSLI